ncbi:MAG TPA: hypothetical protein VJM11_18510 [Nevskiaceae bacterium]|nr:hypothetical protein [Nevskiaceae bacterium]
MNARKTIPALLGATAVAMAALLSGCEADGHDEGRISGGGEGSPLPNDGTTPTTVTDGGPPNGDGSHEVLDNGNFVCTRSVRYYGRPTTTVGANGAIGQELATLLNDLGGTTVTQLLASVTDKDLAIDGDLDTFSRFSLTAGLGGGAVASVDQIIFPGSTVPKDKYAVFGVTFPGGLLEVTALQQLTVTTFRNEVAQEMMTLTRNDLDLLGQVLTGNNTAWLGIRTTKAYDAVSISLAPALGANVGDAVRVHELCTKGRFVDPPTP